MPPLPAETISLPETLGLLDGAFAAFAEGVADGVYGFWLGSGISKGIVPGLWVLSGKVIEGLRTRAAPTGPCRYRESLEQILKIVVLSDDQRKKIDLSQPFDSWTDKDVISEALVANYAKMLDAGPKGEKSDYLLWDVVDVVGIYADPALVPGAAHLALAALVLEGVASDIASANWDGLLEAAVDRLSGALVDILQVRVLEGDVREGMARSHLYKFHGCAVKAKQEASTYRSKLVGRYSQIDTWAGDNAVIEGKLIDLAVTKPTLMLGLSAQDHNIRRVFTDARNRMKWTFPRVPPAFVFSEDSIGFDQRTILRSQYPAQYEAQGDQIDATALLRAFGGNLLPALWVQVLVSKLNLLLDVAGVTGEIRPDLAAGLKLLRDQAAAKGTALNRAAFMVDALTHVGRVLALLRTGTTAISGGGIYAPVSPAPASVLANDPNVTASGLPEFAVGLAILGHGHARLAWTCEATTPSTHSSGALRVSGSRSVEVFFAATAKAAAQLLAHGHIDTAAEVVLIHSDPILAPTTRSATATFGRTLKKIGLREVSVRTVLDSGLDAAAMVERFQLELAL